MGLESEEGNQDAVSSCCLPDVFSMVGIPTLGAGLRLLHGYQKGNILFLDAASRFPGGAGFVWDWYTNFKILKRYRRKGFFR